LKQLIGQADMSPDNQLTEADARHLFEEIARTGCHKIYFENTMHIRKMITDDINGVADIHRAVFVRQQMSREWIEANFRAFPRMQYFVAEESRVICGFIHWTQKSGFRPEVVIELEQIAVHPEYQKRGVGQKLIEKSLPLIRLQIAQRGARLKHIIITTRADNYAQKLYRKTLSAEVEATITNLYSADEVVMIRRNIDKGHNNANAAD
jgi:ribosomal protein S18 acetylase RimI-like enzyme